ncbi:hypothetical protein [Pseudomonas palleroniana]|uniref:hypothetical protein n=1 Tax=Pseudomonas palleroniana TaxID=191390 RepID=UPI001FD4B7AF|nr:hypothetical protein [Pseudomonas palleroniana]UOP13382.1 hypothetical protein LDL65_12760 [Pseudomonas palleroniana]
MKSRTTNLAGPLNANHHCCLGLERNHAVSAKNSISLNLGANVRALANAWAKPKAVIPLDIYHKTIHFFKWPLSQNLKTLTVVTVRTEADTKIKQKPKTQ